MNQSLEKKIKTEDDDKKPDKRKVKTEEFKEKRNNRRVVRREDESIAIDYDLQAGLDSTADIVRNPRFHFPVLDLN